MDICFLPAWYYNIDGKGAGIFFAEQARAIQEFAESVSIFYPALGPQYLGKSDWQLQHSKGLAIFKYQGFCFPKRIASLLFWYKRQTEKAFTLFLANRDQQLPDLIHAHSLWGAYAALLIKEQWGIPFVYTEHLGKWAQAAYQLPSYQLRPLLNIGAAASSVTAVSSALAQQIDAFLGKKITLITPNLVDTTVFHPAESRSLNPRQLKLISIGDPWYTKGLDVLIQAMGKAQQRTEVKLKLTIVDKVPGREHLNPFIQQYHLEDSIQFTGRLDRHTLRNLLQTQDVLVSASRMESFGITMIEGLACGLPVLATHTAGAQDIVQPFCGSLVPPGDAEQLARGILDMIDQLPHYDNERLAEYARTTYGKRAFNTRWQLIYSTILQQA